MPSSADVSGALNRPASPVFSDDSESSSGRDEVKQTAGKVNQLVVFSKQLLFASFLVLFISSSAYFFGVEFWLVKNLLVLGAGFASVGLMGLLSHKVQDFLMSTEHVLKKEKKKQDHFLKDLDCLSLEDLKLDRKEKTPSVRAFSWQGENDWFNPLMQLILNSNLLMGSLTKAEKITNLTDRLKELKRRKHELIKEQLSDRIKTLTPKKKSSGLSSFKGDLIQNKRDKERVLSKVRFLKAFNLFLQSYEGNGEFDERILQVIQDQLGFADVSDVFKHLHVELPEFKTNLVPYDAGTKVAEKLKKEDCLIDLNNVSPQKGFLGLFDNFFTENGVFFEKAPEELFLSFEKQNCSFPWEITLQQDLHLKEEDSCIYELHSFITNDGQAYLKKNEDGSKGKWFSNNAKEKTNDEISRKTTEAVILHYVKQ